ncbi:DUF3450 domain-containing protein [Vibrio sp. SCSIO 43136]|uniref:DUF3450 domain-containing protein n=1 Tax=Vibrio sp. SCSIO 43136 TaxID=2819101 RepID=UPI00207632C1|nr:DUF3450 domain-containing protein [Vibrio sp. SCSIO 43136]USD67020.1 DUF3450 domain-containing protein [Vibrio sp. SCSIO 43136]
MKNSVISCVISAAIASTSVHANTIEQSRKIEQSTNANAVASQKRIDKSAEQVLDKRAEIEQLEEEIANLELYRDHLQGLVHNQEQEMASLDAQVNDIKDTRQGVVPLMYHMIDGLKGLVDQDLPIKKPQRLARISKLEDLMQRADVSDAEKYRQILEAYQIEVDYGTKLAAYHQAITLPQGKVIEAELLNLGRLSLIARSLDNQHFWAWQQSNSQWVALEPSRADSINRAYALANKQVAPQLITLPLSVQPEALQ